MTKQETYDYLTTYGVDFEVTEHPAVFNMAEVAEIPLPHPEADAKNLFVRDDKKLHYYMITVQGDKRVDLKKFRCGFLIHAIRRRAFGTPSPTRPRKSHDRGGAYRSQCASPP